VLPSSARAFACLLYLGLERDRVVPRAELQEALYPDQQPRGGTHSLRQLLYKLRGLGAPLETRADSVTLSADEVLVDYSALLGSDAVSEAVIRAAADGFLPGYSPSFSARFRIGSSDNDRGSLTRFALRSLAGSRGFALRGGGVRWSRSRGLFGIRPAERGGHARSAHGIALSGQKVGAVKLLDGYMDDMGPYGKELRVSASVLRRRISEHVPDSAYHRRGSAPFVGREVEMADLWRHFQEAKRGESRVVVIHGEGGIGKTRLASEFAKAAGVDGATCVKVECVAHDVRRPLGVFADLTPKLLDARVGSACHQRRLKICGRLTTHQSSTDQPMLGEMEPRTVSTAIRRALTDLVDAVASEAPLVLWIDDGNCADPLSFEMMRALVAEVASASCW